jgi:hypothetical protein
LTRALDNGVRKGASLRNIGNIVLPRKARTPIEKKAVATLPTVCDVEKRRIIMPIPDSSRAICMIMDRNPTTPFNFQ